MDAKPPQRAFRPLSTVNNENMAPVMFTDNHQRQKSSAVPLFMDASIAAVKIPAKRTAFGDVSNVVRPLADNAAHGFKTNAIANASKAGLISTAPMPAPPAATYSKENIAQPATTAGFLAPAQRPRNSVSAISSVTIPESDSQNALRQAPASGIAVSDLKEPWAAPLHTGKTFVGVARKATVVFSSEVEFSHAPAVLRPEVAAIVDNFAESAVVNWNKPKRSPRHSKSQPCLKNADGFQEQKKRPLRRTLSRLPVDRDAFKELTVFADDNASISSEPATEDKPNIANIVAQPVDVVDDAAPYNTNLDCNDFPDTNDAPFVDAVEDFHSHDLPPLPDDTEDDIGRLREEVEAAVILTGHQKPSENQGRFIPPPEAPAADYLSDIPAATAASSMSEAEEPWDDDADFYDDQAYTTAHSFRSLGDNTTGGLTTVIMPKMTAKIQNELDIARAIVEASISPEDLDDEAWDISMVAEYGDEIYGYMKELEAKMLPSPYYMDMQTEIQWSMRAVLMEWLIQVHARFNLLPETLFLTVNYIDRFLSSKIVSVAKLQLVGATAIFIAAKYEEIICPSIQEIVYMVDGGYTTDEILKAERFMLSMLGFELGWPGPMSFLRRISKADDYDLDTRTLAKYFLEVTIMDERFVACPPSFLAAGAHCLARMMLFKGDWTTAHTHYSGYTWNQVRPLANTILHCCRDPTAHHAAVYEKYASNKFKKASIYVEEEVRRGFMMPSLQAHHHSRHRLSLTDSLTDSIIESGAPIRSNRMDLLVHTES